MKKRMTLYLIVGLILMIIMGCDERLDIPYYEPCIYMMDADGSNLEIFMKGEWVYLSQFIPNTTKLLFIWNSYLYTFDYINNEINNINDTLQAVSPRVSADGEKISFLLKKNEYFDLFICNIDGTNVQQITNTLKTNEYSQSFSYNTEKIVYVTQTEGETTKYEICTVNIYTGEFDTLVTNVDYRLAYPTFSPNGERIYYIQEYNNQYYFSRLHVMDKNGTHLQEFEDDYVSMKYALNITPDGDKILYMSDSLHVMNSDGSDNLALVKCNGYSLSPDGKEIAYRKYSVSYNSIYKIKLDGSENKLLFFNLAYSDPVFFLYEDRVAFAGYYQINKTKINYLTN